MRLKESEQAMSLLVQKCWRCLLHHTSQSDISRIARLHTIFLSPSQFLQDNSNNNNHHNQRIIQSLNSTTTDTDKAKENEDKTRKFLTRPVPERRLLTLAEVSQINSFIKNDTPCFFHNSHPSNHYPPHSSPQSTRSPLCTCFSTECICGGVPCVADYCPVFYQRKRTGRILLENRRVCQLFGYI